MRKMVFDADLNRLDSGRVNVSIDGSQRHAMTRFMESLGFELWYDFSEYRTDDTFDALFEPSD